MLFIILLGAKLLQIVQFAKQFWIFVVFYFVFLWHFVFVFCGVFLYSEIAAARIDVVTVMYPFS